MGYYGIECNNENVVPNWTEEFAENNLHCTHNTVDVRINVILEASNKT